MKRTLLAARRHPFATFILLAYGLSWWPWPLYLVDQSPAVIIGFGPFLAAVAVLGLTGGWKAVMTLLQRMVQWRVAARWYVLALVLPLVMSGLAIALNVGLGAPVPTPEQAARWPLMLPMFILLLLVPGIGGTWEEPGWRGYALPQLALRRSKLIASVLLTLIWGGWHLPLFVMGIAPWWDLLFIVGATYLLTWAYYGSRGSIVIIMIFHAMSNTAGQFSSSLFTGAALQQLALLRAGVCVLFAVIVVAARWRFWRSEPRGAEHSSRQRFAMLVL